MVSEKKLKEKAKKLSIYEGSAYSVSEGFGLRNVAAYALVLNASNSMISLLTSIPSLLGNLSQFFSHKILLKTSRRKAVSFLVFLQAIFWFFLIMPGIIFILNKDLSRQAQILLLIFYTLLIIFGSIAGPIWTSWMKDIVDEKELGSYFSKRNRIILALIVIFSFIGALFLDLFKKKGNVLIAFFILFFFSFLARSLSAFILTKKYEPKYKLDRREYFSFSQFLGNLPYNNFGRFVIFFAMLNFFVAIAGPFFIVYLLNMKGLSYTTYSLTTFVMVIFSVLTMSFWGSISDKKGNLLILRTTLIGISLIPLIYFSSNYIKNYYFFLASVFLAEAISGFCWGGFNLAASNFIFKIVSREKMVFCTTYFNVINGVAIFLGASIGGFFASHNLLPLNPILSVFLISFFGRLLTYILLFRLKEEKGKFSYKNQFFLMNFFTYSRSFFHQTEQISIAFFKKIKSQFKVSKTF